MINFDLFQLHEDTWMKIFLSIIIIVFCNILNILLRLIINKQTKEPKTRYNMIKTTRYTIFFLGIILVGRIWFQGFQTLATFLGLLSAGIAIALKDIMLNIAGWVFIIIKKPFVVGQRIQIGEHRGDVVDIRVFQFIIMELGSWVPADQSTGRMIHIPNGSVFTLPIQNYETGFLYIWSEIMVNITFESNWKKAKKLLLEILLQYSPDHNDELRNQIKSASQDYLIYLNNLTPIVYTNINKQGIELSLRYICLPRNRRNNDSRIIEEILSTFAQHQDLNFSYPTTRFFDYPQERKDRK